MCVQTFKTLCKHSLETIWVDNNFTSCFTYDAHFANGQFSIPFICSLCGCHQICKSCSKGIIFCLVRPLYSRMQRSRWPWYASTKQTKLFWQCEKTITGSMKQSGMLGWLFNKLNGRNLPVLFIKDIGSAVVYCARVWRQCITKDVILLERVQRRVKMLVWGLWHLS